MFPRITAGGGVGLFLFAPGGHIEKEMGHQSFPRRITSRNWAHSLPAGRSRMWPTEYRYIVSLADPHSKGPRCATAARGLFSLPSVLVHRFAAARSFPTGLVGTRSRREGNVWREQCPTSPRNWVNKFQRITDISTEQFII